MKRLIATLLLLLFACPAHAQFVVQPVEAIEPLPAASDALGQARDDAWNAYSDARLDDPTLHQEVSEWAMTFGEATMRYTVQTVGEMPEEGYPLYIAMHGGGSTTPEANDKQWAHMQYYYCDWLDCGVYVAVRGVRDTWDTHFNPESYPLYDRLIEYMILTESVDPNRVYLEGFSAGGDGVYAISTRMPDRFAAANMSSGHPNDVSLVNLYNLPIQLQAGEFDEDYDRNRITAEYGLKLDALQAEYGGYAHRTLIHCDCGHNYEDDMPTPIPVMSDIAEWLEEGDSDCEDVDSFPPDYMDDFIRDPIPPSVIWDLSTRADTRQTESFYYLSAPYSTDAGTIRVSVGDDNRIEVQTDNVNGEFSMMFNEYMVDFSRPVTFVVDGEESVLTLTPDMTILTASTEDRGDPSYQFEAAVIFSEQ